MIIIGRELLDESLLTFKYIKKLEGWIYIRVQR